MRTLRSIASGERPWPVRSTVTSSVIRRSTRADSAGSPVSVTSLPRTRMSTEGNARSTTRRSSSAGPRSATIGWLAGTTILVFARRGPGACVSVISAMVSRYGLLLIWASSSERDGHAPVSMLPSTGRSRTARSRYVDDGSAGRPPEAAAGEHVPVDVLDALAGVRAGVEHEPVRGRPLDLGHPSDGEHERGQGLRRLP